MSPRRQAGPRRPEPRPGRTRLSRLLPALALLLGALSLFAAAPASAAKLVGTVDQSSQGGGVSLAGSHPYTSQPFTTGSNVAGYRLESAAVRFGQIAPNPSSAAVTAQIWSASGENPGQKLWDLTAPQSLTQFGYNTFRAPPDTVLDPGTTYHLVFRLVAGNSVDFTRIACCTNIDADSAPGWALALRRNSPDGVTWSELGVHQTTWFRIDGEVAPIPASETVSNLRVTPGDRRLSLTWTGPSVSGDTAIRGYDVWYREAVCTKPKRWNAGSSGTPDWVPEFRDGVRVYELCDSANPNQPGPWMHHGAWAGSWDPIARQTTRVIDGLWPGVAYDVRVRVRTTKRVLPWVLARGTPSGGSSNARLLQIQLIADQLQQ